MECARVLCDSVQSSSQCTERSPVDGVRMRSSNNIWPCLVNCRMNHVCCSVQQPAFTTVYDIAFLVHADEVRRFDQAEGNTERVYPKSRRIHRIPERYVTSHSFIKTILAENSEGS